MSQNRELARKALTENYYRERDAFLRLLSEERRNLYCQRAGGADLAAVRAAYRVLRFHRRAYWAARNDSRAYLRPVQ